MRALLNVWSYVWIPFTSPINSVDGIKLGPPEPLISEAEKIVLEASERVRIIEEQEERIKKDKKDKKDKDAKVEEEKRAMAAAAEALELERNPPLGM